VSDDLCIRRYCSVCGHNYHTVIASLPGRAVESASMMSLKEIQNAVRTGKLPIDEIEDRSLVFPTATKH
jgi:hypothetical protein